MNEHYAWRGGSEWLLRHGEAAEPTVLVLPALFEEANRMRRFTVSVMRGLAARGIGTILPDLPGMGESVTALADVTLADCKEAVATLANDVREREGRCFSLAIRGGALFDSAADYGWRLAPESGDRVLRDLVRATALSSGQSATDVDRRARLTPTMLAGNLIAPEFYVDLMAAPMLSTNRRIVRLADDAGARDISLSGSRLWRAAEPGDDPNMSEAAVADIALWVHQCAV